MTEEHRGDGVSEAFGRALVEAEGATWRHDPTADLAVRHRRRRRSQVIGAVLAVLVLGGAVVGGRMVDSGASGRGTPTVPLVTAPSTTEATTTTTKPCPDPPDPAEPCAMASEAGPSAPASRPPSARSPEP